MRVTVIPADRWIRRDDDAANLPEWPFKDVNIHAIQWYDIEGEVEYTDHPKPPNKIITSPSILAPYLEALDAFLVANLQPQPEPAPGTTTLT